MAKNRLVVMLDDKFSLVYSFDDPIHSINENRFIEIGLSTNYRILVVVYTERQNKIRMISSRKATLTERRLYEQSRP